MAKDDYFVIVYQILSYLYKCLKEGTKIDERLIRYDSPYIKINERYWCYIIWHMQQEKLIEGISFIEDKTNDIHYPDEVARCRITPTGIGYLCDNSFMEKAKKFFKDAKDIISFA